MVKECRRRRPSLAAANDNNLNTAYNQIDTFINAVIARSGNQLAVDQANQLLVRAAQIGNALGCRYNARRG
jgi:hypothetical protein